MIVTPKTDTFKNVKVRTLVHGAGHQSAVLTDDYEKLLSSHQKLEIELDMVNRRNDWFSALFERKWNGVVGSGSKYFYELRGDWRHIVKRLEGETLDIAVDKEIE